MSTFAITAAHFVAIPIRYAVGRWYNIPTNTLIAFNAADIGLRILIRQIEYYTIAKKQWGKISIPMQVAYSLIHRVVTCLAGVYVASILTAPMPLEAAALTNLAACAAVVGALYLVEKPKK